MPSKPSILVVDDEKANCDLYFEVLTSEDLYTVDVANNGAQALEMAEIKPYDVIISDITMPQLDGLSFLKKIKERNQQVEVIMISGAGSIDSAIESFRSHAFDYLTKPVEIDKLLTTVKSALSKRELTERIQQLKMMLPHMQTGKEDLYLGHVLINQAGDILNIDARLAPTNPALRTHPPSGKIQLIPELSFAARDLLNAAAGDEDIARRWAVLGLKDQLRVVCYNTRSLRDWISGPAALATFVDLTSVKRQEKEKRDREKLSALGEMTKVVTAKVNRFLEGIARSGEAINVQVQTLNGTARPNIPNILMVSSQGIAAITQQVNQVRGMMSTLEDFSRQYVPQYVGLDLNKLIRDTVDQAVRPVADRIQVSYEFKEDLPTVHGSEKDLKQVINSLVENAIQAIAAEGQIIVATSNQAGLITMAVADSGQGIPWDLQEKIFEPFFTTRGERAKGLGLALARKAVEDHDGVITVESQQGGPTQFTITLLEHK